MSTDSSYRTSGQQNVPEATLDRQRDKVTRIAAMAKKLRDEVQSLDATGPDRLRAIDAQTIGELLPDLSPDLRHELNRLAEPLTTCTELSDAELRIAHAQLVGWLQGLVQPTPTASFDGDAAPATTGNATPAPQSASTDIPTSESGRNQPIYGVHSAVNNRVVDVNLRDCPVVTARRMLITAITERIAQECLTAAQAAAALRLTGPRVTALLNGNIDEFTLDELINLLPALELTIEVVAEPQRCGYKPRLLGNLERA
jgi:predicted XRE-type DNA-binding protein